MNKGLKEELGRCLEKRVLGRGNGLCKGTEVETCLVCSGHSERNLCLEGREQGASRRRSEAREVTRALVAIVAMGCL